MNSIIICQISLVDCWWDLKSWIWESFYAMLFRWSSSANIPRWIAPRFSMHHGRFTWKKMTIFLFFSKPALLARKCLVAPCLVPLAPAEAKPPSKELRWCAIISHFMASSTLYFKVCKLFRYLEIWVFWPQVFSAEVVLIIICCY